MKPSPMRAININACAQKIEVDNRISLHYYYRIADTLLKQASIYREEKNLIDLYIILLRFSSLMCETIPSHRDYHVLLPKERVTFKKKLLDVINELESLKTAVQRQVDEVNRGHMFQPDVEERISYNSTTSSVDWPSTKKQFFANSHIEQPTARNASQGIWKHSNEQNRIVSSDQLQIGRPFQKVSLSLPLPKEETLSRHSILGPNGLWGQQTGPITSLRVQYPSNVDLVQTETSRGNCSEMESVLSLDDGRWSLPAEESFSPIDATQEDLFKLNVKQPSPPPVLAHVQQEMSPIPPSKVADPRPGVAKTLQDGMPNSKTFQHLHIPVKMLECFLRLAEMNTKKNLETCGVLAGSLKNSMFYVTTLIVPKQESTSDSCQTTNEEEIFDFQDKRALFPLGWIHTHPSQTCFMSSIDLHTHYSYQIMLPEAIAIVMAPTDTSRTHGIFHLSDPGGVSVIRNCQQRGFHPHEEPSDGSSIYEHCSHVYMNPNLKFEVEDLR